MYKVNEKWSKSKFTLATPDDTIPTPTSDTSFTDILAVGLAHFKSYIS